MTARITAEAEADLASIAAFIGAANPARAISFVQQLVASCHTLADRPLRHPLVTDYRIPLRRFSYRGYSIYYLVDTDEDVTVVHILNDAMDHRRILED